MGDCCLTEPYLYGLPHEVAPQIVSKALVEQLYLTDGHRSLPETQSCFLACSFPSPPNIQYNFALRDFGVN